MEYKSYSDLHFAKTNIIEGIELNCVPKTRSFTPRIGREQIVPSSSSSSSVVRLAETENVKEEIPDRHHHPKKKKKLSASQIMISVLVDVQ